MFGTPSATFLRFPAASVVDQDLPHHLRGERKKVSPTLKSGLLLPDHAGIRLMDQRGGLERVAGGFVAQEAFGKPPEFGVDQRHDTVESIFIAVRKLLQQQRDRRCFRHV